MPTPTPLLIRDTRWCRLAAGVDRKQQRRRIQGNRFSANIPDANKVKKTETARWWYDSGGSYAEGSAADPIADLKALAAAAEEKGSAFHFEVDKLTFRKPLHRHLLSKAIGYHMFPAAASDAIASNVAKNAGEEGRKAALEAIIGFPIKVIDSLSRVDKYDKSKRL